MALAGDVLDENHFAGADDPAFTVARGELHARVEIHDVLTARRRMPVEVVLGNGLAKNDSVGRQPFRELAAAPFFGPFDLDIAEVRLAVRVGVQVVNTHLISLWV